MNTLMHEVNKSSSLLISSTFLVMFTIIIVGLIFG